MKYEVTKVSKMPLKPHHIMFIIYNVPGLKVLSDTPLRNVRLMDNGLTVRVDERRISLSKQVTVCNKQIDKL